MLVTTVSLTTQLRFQAAEEVGKRPISIFIVYAQVSNKWTLKSPFCLALSLNKHLTNLCSDSNNVVTWVNLFR